MGVFRWIRPSQVVANHENTLMPVGTAIRSVVIIIGTRSQGHARHEHVVGPRSRG